LEAAVQLSKLLQVNGDLVRAVNDHSMQLLALRQQNLAPEVAALTPPANTTPPPLAVPESLLPKRMPPKPEDTAALHQLIEDNHRAFNELVSNFFFSSTLFFQNYLFIFNCRSSN